MPKRYSLGPLLGAIILLMGCGGAPTASKNLFGPGAGSQLTAASAIQFGAVPVGGTRSSSVVVGNSAKDGTNVTVSQIKIAGTGFGLGDTPALPLVIAPGESVTLGIEFSPKLSGTAKGEVSIMSDAANPVLPVSLAGNGNSATQMTVSPSVLNFGTVGIGGSAVLTGKLIAGNSSVTVSTVDETGQGYSLSGITFPVTLAAGQQMPFSVTFTPEAAGVAAGSLSFVTNASTSPTETVTGSGTQQPVAHSVTLSWGATASPVAGYNIYRGVLSGGPYAKLTVSPTPGTSYSDSAVQSGATYYYVATAVNSSSQESGYSNQTVATVP